MSDLNTLHIVKTAHLGDPFVTAGEHAYLIGTQDGGFPDMGRHVEGEMAGLWAHPIKLIDGLWLRLDGTWVTGAQRFTAGSFWDEHAYELPGDTTVRRSQFVPDGEPALVVRYTFRTPSPRTLQLRVLARVNLQGVWLSDMSGYQDSYDHAFYDQDLRAWIGRDDRNPWYVVFGARGLEPRGHESGRDLWGPETTTGLGVSVALDYELDVAADEDAVLEIVVAGSDGGMLPARASFTRVSAALPSLRDAKAARYTEMLARSTLEIPDAVITRAWDWVKCNYDWLVRAVPAVGRGLGAGLPDYPWWFGCDNAYALRGCLALGQHDIAVDTLDLLRSVSLAHNGASGRVIHECNTRGFVANRGNTQETPHFTRAVWDTFLWTGDVEFLRRNYAFCKRGVLEWTLDTACGDGDLLPHGYGIIEKKHLNLACIDTAALTVEALGALAGMAHVLGENGVALRCRALHRALHCRLEEAFWMDGEGLYGDIVATPAAMAPRLRYWAEEAEQPDHRGAVKPDVADAFRRLLHEAETDPEQDRERPWPCLNWTLLCPLEAGLTDPEKARLVLDRVEGPAFTGRWGMYLSGIDRSQSMSINTSILAVSELQYGRVDRGLAYIRTLAETLDLQMPGAIAEMSPDYGCFVQAWSGYGIAWPVVTQVFGLRPDAFARCVTLDPVFPENWPRASLRNVRVGSNTLDIHWDGQSLRVTSREPGWTITSPRVPLAVTCSPGD